MLALDNINNRLPRYTTGNSLSELENYYALVSLDTLRDLGLVEAENYFSNALSLDGGFGKKTTEPDNYITGIFENNITTASEDLFLNDIFSNPLTIMDVVESSEIAFETDTSLTNDLVSSLKEASEDLLPPPERQTANEETQEVSDGVIDHFNQGQVGNCWFLAAIDAFVQTAEGRDKLSESISTDADGNYNVTFASDPEFEFTITPEEIEERRKTAGVSSGDIDMQILELAYEKLQASRMEDRGLPGIHIWEALSGEKLESSGDRPTQEHAEALLREITGGEGVTEGFGISFGSAVNMETGEAVYYSDTEEGHNAGHSFAITSIDWDSGTMTYENPWDTQNEKTMSLDDFYELLEKGGGFNWTANNPL